MKRTPRRALVALALLAGACSEAAPTAAEEVAGELRALRLALAQQARAVAAPPSERVDVQAALAPLREALDALAGSQRELAERQVALTQEMQRWAQLLVESVTGSKAEEAKAMAQRLGELETKLKQQDTRHREVETLLQGALERTADQLDVFLKRLETIGPVRRSDAGSGGPPVAPPTPANGAGGNGAGSNGAGSNATGGSGASGNGAGGNDVGPKQAGLDGIVKSRAPASRWWWLGLSGLGLGVATLCLRRSRRSQLSIAAPAVAGVTPPEGERSVEEIWAAAALLGEAVGRLRQTVAAPTGAEPAAAAETSTADEAEFAFLDDDDGVDVEHGFAPVVASPPAAALPPAAVAPPAPASPAPFSTPALTPPPRASAPTTVGPLDTLVALLPRGAGERDILTALAAERGVLRRPAPTIAPRGSGVEVRFHVVPGSTPADRVRLLQRLRDALRDRRSSAD